MDMARPLYDRFGPDQIAIIDDVEKVSRTYGFSAAAFRPGLKTVISGAIWLSIGLYGGTATGPIFTEVAKGVGGIELGAGIMMITSFAILCNPAGAILFLAFVNGNPVTIGIAVIVYIICYVLVRKNRDRIHDWVEKQAENPGGASPAAA